MNSPCSTISDSTAAIRYLTEAARNQFGSSISVTRLISVGSFAATSILTVGSAAAESISVCLGKVCAGPLSREGKIYELANGHPLLPRCYGVHWLAEDLAVVFLEMLQGPLLKDKPSTEALQTVISLIVRFHVHMMDRLGDFLELLGHQASLPCHWVTQAKTLISRSEAIAGPLGP
jgi:hypothetical protein